ncbi:MAG: sulfotransferase domain-containing protein, partial [Thermodesulfobacteriota bacterium]|nr:sulfotransferase domain-containing protein [Thermodesulfobacteriota bacterium]
EKRIFSWCIQNYVPLRQFNEGEIYIAFYENICTDPKNEIRKLFLFLGEHFDDTIFNNELVTVLKNPSALAYKWSAIRSGNNLIESWKKDISENQVDRVIKILKLFRVDNIYSKEPLPNIR